MTCLITSDPKSATTALGVAPDDADEAVTRLSQYGLYSSLKTQMVMRRATRGKQGKIMRHE